MAFYTTLRTHVSITVFLFLYLLICIVFRWMKKYFWHEPIHNSRSIILGNKCDGYFAKNIVRNQKYSLFSFLPYVLYEQFKFFLNFFFLCIALSQFIEALRIGSFIAYWGPLVSFFFDLL